MARPLGRSAQRTDRSAAASCPGSRSSSSVSRSKALIHELRNPAHCPGSGPRTRAACRPCPAPPLVSPVQARLVRHPPSHERPASTALPRRPLRSPQCAGAGHGGPDGAPGGRPGRAAAAVEDTGGTGKGLWIPDIADHALDNVVTQPPDWQPLAPLLLRLGLARRRVIGQFAMSLLEPKFLPPSLQSSLGHRSPAGGRCPSGPVCAWPTRSSRTIPVPGEGLPTRPSRRGGVPSWRYHGLSVTLLMVRRAKGLPACRISRMAVALAPWGKTGKPVNSIRMQPAPSS